MAPEAAANPKVGKTFLAKNGNTSFPKLSKLLKKPPCFCNCVLLYLNTVSRRFCSVNSIYLSTRQLQTNVAFNL